jgi:hypothetical protein
VGDEFVLNALGARGSFERVNVSYEYREYGVSYDSAAFTIRHGGQTLVSDSYYKPDVLTPGITASQRSYVPSFGGEYRRAWGSGTGFASLDARHDIVYDYHRPTPDTPERQQWSYNLAAGYRPEQSESWIAVREMYVRVYYGVNPNGQFRNQANYFTTGFGINFGH